MKEKTDVIILNKPIDYSVSEALELLEEHKITHTHSISDLDSNSEGLVVFVTNTYATEPEVYENEYEITIDEYLSKAAENILTKGMNIEGKNYSGIILIEEKHKGKRSVVRISSTKTNDIDIKKMFEAIGYHVVSMRRIRIGKFKLGVLSIGRWKFI
ncbi:MAG: hypothetical protein KBD29_00665 [Candidatus Magasanikbacteria bacterium]|nr:hypothetical protein [Candidatus Magasanikbacteria bacterium]